MRVALPWAAAPYLETEKHFKRIHRYRDLWIPKAPLNEEHTPHHEMVA
ncbi:MAG: hypothetical protein PVH68_16260 [Armatimonadota bacterium]